MIKTLSRRDLFTRKGLEEFGRSLGLTVPETSEPDYLTEYFRSPLHSYPLLQEMPQEMLEQEARKFGIAIDNRSKNEIARDLFMRVHKGG